MRRAPGRTRSAGLLCRPMILAGYGRGWLAACPAACQLNASGVKIET